MVKKGIHGWERVIITDGMVCWDIVVNETGIPRNKMPHMKQWKTGVFLILIEWRELLKYPISKIDLIMK